MTFAARPDLDPALFLEAVRGGAMDAPYVQLKGNAMLAGDFTPAFVLDGAVKDATLMIDAARSVDAEVAIVEIAHRYLTAASKAGHGEEHMAATYLAH